MPMRRFCFVFALYLSPAREHFLLCQHYPCQCCPHQNDLRQNDQHRVEGKGRRWWRRRQCACQADALGKKIPVRGFFNFKLSRITKESNFHPVFQPDPLREYREELQRMMISHSSTSSFKNSSNALSTHPTTTTPTTSTINEPPTTRAGPPQASAQSSTTWQRTPLEVSQPRICYPAPPVQCPVHLPLLSPPVVLPQAQPGPRMPMPSFNLTTVPPPSPLTRPPMPIVRTDNLVK